MSANVQSAVATAPLTDRTKIYRRSKTKDRIFRNITTITAVGSMTIVVLGALALMLPSVLKTYQASGLSFLVNSDWDPVSESFGALIPIYGTIVSSFVAVLIAVPLAFGIAIYLTQLCPRPLRPILGGAIELLAGIPSIAYGMWGMFVLVPFMDQYVFATLAEWFDGIPILEPMFASTMRAGGLFDASLVLAIMILPFIAAVFKDLFGQASDPDKNESVLSMYGLGATMWEVMRNLVIPLTKVGTVGGILLGLGRALGETMAVTFVIGGTYRLGGLFDPGISIAASIALNFGEAQNGSPLKSTLFTLAVVLCVISMTSVAIAQFLLRASSGKTKTERKEGAGVTKTALKTDEVDPTAQKVAQGPEPHTHSYYRIKDLLHGKRERKNALACVLSTASTFLALLMLAIILFYIAGRGIAGLSMEAFVKLQPAIVGTLTMVLIATLGSVFVGVLIGTYTAFYGTRYENNQPKETPIGFTIRFINRVLLSTPSIIVGVLVYQACIVPLGIPGSGYAGALALGVMAFPVIASSSDDGFRQIPLSLRESALALGATRAQVILKVEYWYAMRSIVTGVVLAIARVIGETASLLYTAFGNPSLTLDPRLPMASMGPKIYELSSMTNADVAIAWAGVLLLTIIVLVLNVSVRVLAPKT